MKHIFPFQRNLLKAVRPIANRVAPIELPADSYFANIRVLFEKLKGVDEVMEDPHTTSVRLVTNPEKMVLRETQANVSSLCRRSRRAPSESEAVSAEG
jgi:arsenite-transporting ATPase